LALRSDAAPQNCQCGRSVQTAAFRTTIGYQCGKERTLPPTYAFGISGSMSKIVMPHDPVWTEAFASEAKIVSRAISSVRERSCGPALPSNLSVTINFHPDWSHDGLSVIERIASDGVYRSQFETGTSNGGMTAYLGGARWRWEQRIFEGAYDDAPAELRPKYGALNDCESPFGGAPRFGSAHFRLHPKVLERTTFCFPDSYLDPIDFGVVDRLDLLALKEVHFNTLEPLDRYIEAHVHGRLEVATALDALVLDPSHRGTIVEDYALALGCQVEWHPGFRLSVDRQEDCARYRGEEVADLVLQISRDGFLTPRDIGLAQRGGIASPVLLKRLWHCLACLGSSTARPPA
jgi:hypothetical protein